MKASDVVIQLQSLLPQHTALFTDDVAVTSLTRVGTVMTAVTAAALPVKFGVGDAVAITGATTQIPIGVSRSGEVGTLVTTALNHDLTAKIAPTITLSGATEAEFNGTFTVLEILNRTTITFTMADSGPTVATGSPILEDAESPARTYSKTFAVTAVPTTTSFTFTQPDTTLLDPVGTIVARIKPRVSAGVNPERLMEAYTKKTVDELWLFVVLDDVTSSKSRDIASDAIDNLKPGNLFRQQVIQGVTLYLFVPVVNEVAAAGARDTVEDLFRPLCQSMLASTFPSGLFEVNAGTVVFVAHGPLGYNTAVYVHGYSFQQTVDLYAQDTVGPDLDVAFRDICLSMAWELPDPLGSDASAPSTVDIDLDENAFAPQLVSLDYDGIERMLNLGPQALGIENRFSVALWWKPDAGSSDAQGVFASGSASSPFPGFIRLLRNTSGSPSLVETQLRDSAAGTLLKRFEYENLAIEDEWNFSVLTWDGTNFSLFHEGVFVVPTSKPRDDPGVVMADLPLRDITVGVGTGTGVNGFKGRIHSCGMWSAVLTPSEVSELFNLGRGRDVDWGSDSVSPGAYASSTALQHWWRLGFDSADIGRDYGNAAVLIDLDDDSVGIDATDIVVDSP